MSPSLDNSVDARIAKLNTGATIVRSIVVFEFVDVSTNPTISAGAFKIER